MSITDRIDNITRIPEDYLAEAPPAPKSVKIELSPRCNYRCLRGDTLVDTIYGRIPIKELAENYTTVPVFTYRDGEVFVADAVNIRKTGKDRPLVRVHFDDGSHIDCTPDHRFLQFRTTGRATEEWEAQACDLRPGARVRAYRENIAGKGYVRIAWGRQFARHRSRLVMDYLMGRRLRREEFVHHMDGNKSNDHPSNLEYMESAKAHAAAHPEIAQRMREDNPAKNMTPEWAEKLRISLAGKTRSLEQRLRYRESKLGERNPNYIDGSTKKRSRIAEINHKVVSVEGLKEQEDVYCLEVPESGWFFANKVLVHNCGFCALRTREKQPSPADDMDWSLFARITREMRESGVEEIGIFYLGETLMSPTMAVMATRYLKQQLGFPYVFLTSNASLARPKLVKALMNAGLDSLKWSVNAATPEQFAEIMDVSVRWFDKALDNIREAKRVRDEGGYATGLYASSIRYDGEQQERMEDLLDKHVRPYVDQHYWLPLYQMGMYANKIEHQLGYSPTHGNMGRLDALREPIPCWSAFTEGHVRADGGLSVCCFGSDSRFDAGDLTKQTFMDAWNSSKFREIRRAHLKARTEGTKALDGTMCEVCVAFDG